MTAASVSSEVLLTAFPPSRCSAITSRRCSRAPSRSPKFSGRRFRSWSSQLVTPGRRSPRPPIISIFCRRQWPLQQNDYRRAGIHPGRAWEAIPEPKRQFLLQIVQPDGIVDTFRIGPHTPTMKNEDVVLLHRLWLKKRYPGTGFRKCAPPRHSDPGPHPLRPRLWRARSRRIVKELRRHSAQGGPLPVRRIAEQIPTVSAPTYPFRSRRSTPRR